VAGGAFGTHSLKAVLASDMLAVFETAVRYQMYHALALVLVGVLSEHVENRTLTLAGSLFVVGVLLFSGSLYLLAFVGIRWLGAVTPLGGLALLGGWITLAVGCRSGIRTTGAK
jgi:uncharacterized membrane protein YgdD (TMEM256/DUF423 family)